MPQPTTPLPSQSFSTSKRHEFSLSCTDSTYQRHSSATRRSDRTIGQLLNPIKVCSTLSQLPRVLPIRPFQFIGGLSFPLYLPISPRATPQTSVCYHLAAQTGILHKSFLHSPLGFQRARPHGNIRSFGEHPPATSQVIFQNTHTSTHSRLATADIKSQVRAPISGTPYRTNCLQTRKCPFHPFGAPSSHFRPNISPDCLNQAQSVLRLRVICTFPREPNLLACPNRTESVYKQPGVAVCTCLKQIELAICICWSVTYISLLTHQTVAFYKHSLPSSLALVLGSPSTTLLTPCAL